MTLATFSRLSVAAVAGLVSATTVQAENSLTPVAAKGNDGIYAVNVATRRGDCDKGYNWLILVSGGRVSSAGDTPMEASGLINSRGAVNLLFRGFGQVAKVTGRVASGAGTGTWSSATMQCSGSWRAIRRGWEGR